MRRRPETSQPDSARAKAIEHALEARRAELAAAYQEAANDPVFVAEMMEFDPYTCPDEDASADPLTA